jgi:hypothetical protein
VLKLRNVLPREERRMVPRDEFYEITSHALSHQFDVPSMSSEGAAAARATSASHLY